MRQRKIPRKPIARILLAACALYLLIGLLYTASVVVCYNVRNWDVYGGFSLPPLFCFGAFFDLLLWPVYLRVDFVNDAGIFGTCRPLP